jgi:alkyl hydroperoxide reductase subunit D
MQAHERVVVVGGLTEDQVQEAIRIAATINGAAVALEVAPLA